MTQTQLAVDSTHEKVENVTRVTMGLLTGKQGEVARSGGIFTKEDLLNVKLYVKHALSLPFTRAEVENYIGYQRTTIDGLTPASIWTLFQGIRLHSLSWDRIENNIKMQNKHLEITAKGIISTGTEIISIIDSMPIMERIKTEVGALSKEKLADVIYGEEDHAIAGELVNFMDAMKTDITEAQARTAKIKAEISDFKILLIGGQLSNNVLVLGLEPQVKLKDNLMQQHNLKNVIRELQDEINEKNERIEQLKKDYNEYIKKSFLGLAGGLIGLAITGGIFGDKAERARKEKNRLIEAVGKLENQVKNKKGLQETFERLSRNFSDMGIRMVDAEIAVSHLDLMWQSMLAEINESQKQFGHINNALRLTSFITYFRKVIHPWNSVNNSARYLSDMFDEALREYQKQYEIDHKIIAESTPMSIIAFPSSGISYPDIDIQHFRQAIKNLFRLVELESQGINTIREKTTRIKLYARELDEAIQQALSTLRSYLSNIQIQGYFDNISEIDAARASPECKKEDDETLSSTRVEIFMSLSSELARIGRLFCENNNALEKRIADLRNVVVAGRVEDSLMGEQKRQKELSAEIAQKIQYRDSIREERIKLIESQDIVRKHNLADLFKDYLPSGSDIDGLDFTIAKKEAIKQAIKHSIEIFRKIMGSVSDGLKYSDLAKARKKLDNQIDKVNQDINELKINLEQVEQLIKDINSVLQIDIEREFIFSEAEKLSQAWQVFIAELTALQNTEISSLNLNRLLKGQKNFLDNLTQQYSA